MIARSLRGEEPPEWELQLRDAYRDPLVLLSDLAIEPARVRLSTTAGAAFPFRVTRAFASRMVRGDPDDPLLRQVLPYRDEDAAAAGYSDDPVGEHGRIDESGLIRKYRGRALLVLTGACAINCRYCFRRTFPYADALGRGRLARAVDAVAADPDLTEVILSGGDPLVLGDDALAALAERLGDIAHLRRLRIHTRMPVVLPARVTARLLAALARSKLPLVLVIHANHPREIDDAVADALAACRSAGMTLLNQAVLLRAVNDDARTLASLSETLFAAGVLPYYVNLLDRVSGSAHFEVTDREALRIQSELRALLPGYLVPRFVREIAGAPAKMPFA